MTRPLLLLGHSIHVIDIIDLCDRLSIPVAGIIDSDYYGNTAEYEGVPFIGSEATVDFRDLKKTYDFHLGVNPVPGVQRNIEKRFNFINIIEQYDLSCPNLIDPQSRVNHRAKLGKGIFVNYSGVVGPYATIGDHCMIHGLCGVGHHSTLGKNVILQRSAIVSSNISVGDNTIICVGSMLLKNGQVVGANSYIHPGLTVMRDVDDNEVISLAGGNTRRIYNTVVTND